MKKMIQPHLTSVLGLTDADNANDTNSCKPGSKIRWKAWNYEIKYVYVKPFNEIPPWSKLHLRIYVFTFVCFFYFFWMK